MKAGKAQGRKAGLAAGKEAGEEAGRAAGYSSGYAQGRSSALGGLASGGWYVVRVGSDGSGPVVSGATPVAAGACYASTAGGAQRPLLSGAPPRPEPGRRPRGLARAG